MSVAFGTAVEARPDDLDALLALEDMFPEADRISRRSWQRFLAQSGTVFVMRSGDGVVAAAVLLFRSNSGIARLYSIAVAPQVRGKGLGQILLSTCETRARMRGCRHLSLEVRASNRPAIKLYRSAGFENAGLIAGYYDDGEDALKMRKALPGADEK